ncbi:MAG: hypothetical protein IJJ47_09240 [Methanosphaera sp.]|nr:hypothetical protein [Methanosphaera sp.]
MEIINFTDFNYDEKTYTNSFKVSVIENNKLKHFDEIYFKLDEKNSINDNVMAVVLTTLTGQLYDKIYYDLELNENIIQQISDFTKSKVSCKQKINTDFINNNINEKIILNFSGGFDSLALLSILPKNKTEMVSVKWDMENNYLKRESDFFKKFNPHILETNFRNFVNKTKVEQLSGIWQFMSIGSMLYNELLHFKFHTFGTIFEAWGLHGSSKVSTRKKFSNPPFNQIGLTDLKICQGLTEVGTALIVAKSFPYLVDDSLKSLAAPNSTKYYRKQLIMKIIQEKYGLKDMYLNLNDFKEPERKIDFNYFADGFLVLWYLKHIGFEKTKRIVSNLPEDIMNVVDKCSLNFYEKYNSNFLNNLPEDIKLDVMKNLIKLGILPYDEQDYQELKIVLEYLKDYYPILKDNWDKYF